MAFEFLRAENDAAPIEKELVATKNEAYVHGEAVKFSSGKLTKASGADKPEFIYAGKDVAEILAYGGTCKRSVILHCGSVGGCSGHDYGVRQSITQRTQADNRQSIRCVGNNTFRVRHRT